MPSALPAIVRTSGRTGLRVAFSGALALGLLTSAPTTNAHAAAAASSAGHHQAHQHHAKHPFGRSARRVIRAARVAASQKGDPYSYGASGPGSFDCSGLTYYSYRRVGFERIPRTSSAQAHFAQHIRRSNMRRGDLMFFYDGGGVYHVGVYAGFSHGSRWVLHAPYSGTRVRTEKVWTNQWFPGTLRYR